MQVSVEQSGVIERKLTISVPAEKIETEVAKRLKEVARNARIPGFRPGKAPHNIIKKRYSPQVTHEVINETIHSSYEDALGQEKIVPAGLLSIEPTPYESGKALTYIATIELFPEIPMPTLAGKTITKPVVEIVDEDVIDALKELQKRRANFAFDDGKSVVDDRLTIDFEGKIEGKPFAGGDAAGFSVILGGGQMLEQFEAGLVGLKQGETKTIAFAFPENYGNSDIAGKKVEFAVTVKAVEKPSLSELNDDFAKSLGIEEGGIEALKQKISADLQRVLDARMRTVLRDRVLDALYVANDIEAPSALVEAEIDQSVKNVSAQMTAAGLPAGKIDRDDYVDAAKKSVVLALTVSAVVEKFKIKTDADAVRASVMEMPMYSEQNSEYAAWCRANAEQLKYIEAMQLEEQIITCLLETATVQQKAMPFKAFINPTD